MVGFCNDLLIVRIYAVKTAFIVRYAARFSAMRIAVYLHLRNLPILNSSQVSGVNSLKYLQEFADIPFFAGFAMICIQQDALKMLKLRSTLADSPLLNRVYRGGVR
jgi:hypothetical protein